MSYESSISKLLYRTLKITDAFSFSSSERVLRLSQAFFFFFQKDFATFHVLLFDEAFIFFLVKVF